MTVTVLDTTRRPPRDRAGMVHASVAEPASGEAANPTGVRQYEGTVRNPGAWKPQPGLPKLGKPPVGKDGKPSLYAPREPIHPRRVDGTFRRLKWIIMVVTLGIYYVTPWLRWDRGPYAPDQFALVDIAARRFYFGPISIWPQEFYFVAGLLIMAGLGLFLVTSAVGRAWCGYACPQTVWTDLFVWVERLILGDRNARMKLDKEPWTAPKIARRTLVHAIWIAIAVATGGAWIFYFADAPTLLGQFLRGDAAPVAYITVGILTATTYVFGGLMREQVCTYMCPWPRIQGAMMDKHSLTVTYNGWRGEPRSRHQKRAMREGLEVGDCVDCNACVAVCPTGIDIRDGQQLPCITCALCIDACNEVMDKVGKPRGLISYATLGDYAQNERRAAAIGREAAAREQVVPGWREVLRPRTALYFALWSAIGLAMVYAVTVRDRLDVTVLADRNPQYTILSDGDVRVGYNIKLANMEARPREFDVGLDLPSAAMWLADGTLDPARRFAVAVEPDRVRDLRVFVRQEREAVEPGSTPFTFTIHEIGGREGAAVEARFSAPER